MADLALQIEGTLAHTGRAALDAEGRIRLRVDKLIAADEKSATWRGEAEGHLAALQGITLPGRKIDRPLVDYLRAAALSHPHLPRCRLVAAPLWALSQLSSVADAPELRALPLAHLSVCDASGALIMGRDWIEGVLLEDWLEERGPAAPLAELLSVFGELASAVHALHARGLTHGALWPHEVVVASAQDRGGAWKPHAWLVDVGSWRVAARRPAEGARGYAAPETLGGPPPTDWAKADQLSLGAILYQLLTAELPPGTKSDTAAGRAEALKLAPPVESTTRGEELGLTPDLSAAVAKALSPDPRARHADVAALLAALGFGAPALATLPEPETTAKRMRPTKPLEEEDTALKAPAPAPAPVTSELSVSAPLTSELSVSAPLTSELRVERPPDEPTPQRDIPTAHFRRPTAKDGSTVDDDDDDAKRAPGGEWSLNRLSVALAIALAAALVAAAALWVQLSHARADLDEAEETLASLEQETPASEPAAATTSAPAALPAPAPTVPAPTVPAPTVPAPTVPEPPPEATAKAALPPAPEPPAIAPGAPADDHRLFVLITVGTRHYADKVAKKLRRECRAPVRVYRQKRGRCAYSHCYAVAVPAAQSAKAKACGAAKGRTTRDAQDFQPL